MQGGTGGHVLTVTAAVHRVLAVPADLFLVVVLVGRVLVRQPWAVSAVLDPVAPGRPPVIDRPGRSTPINQREHLIVNGPVTEADRIDLGAPSTVTVPPARPMVTVPVPAEAQARAATGPEAADRIGPKRTDRALTEASAANGPAVLALGDHRLDRDGPIGSTTRSVDATGREPSEAGVTSSGHPAPHRRRRTTAAVAVAKSPSLPPRRRPSCGNQPAGKAVRAPRSTPQWTHQPLPK